MSNMTLNYWMMVERYPTLKNEVDGSIPDCETSYLLDIELASWPTASCALTLACRPSVSKKKKRKLKISKKLSKKYLKMSTWYRLDLETLCSQTDYAQKISRDIELKCVNGVWKIQPFSKACNWSYGKCKGWWCGKCRWLWEATSVHALEFEQSVIIKTWYLPR